MTIQDEGRLLADRLENGMDQGGMFLGPADCELAARALRWFVMIGDRISDQLDDEVPPARKGPPSVSRRLS